MLFEESDAPHLKAWIVGRLANDSDADADVLADYVLALLRHDDTADNIRKMFDVEIPDFLREGASAFNDDVFQVVKYKSYLPGAPPAPPVIRQPIPQAHTQVPPQFDTQYQPQAPFVQAAAFSPFGPATTRKRAYNDHDDNDVNFILDSRDSYLPTQPYKQARRGGRDFAPRGGRFDDGYGTRGPRGEPNPYPAPGPMGQFGQPPSYPPFAHGQNLPPVDPNSILENIQRLQQLGIPIPQASELPRPVYSGPAMPQPRRKNRRCRDYDTKGYCSRGSRCMFEHGSESVYLPQFGAGSEEYDPHNPHNASMPLGAFGLPPTLDMAMDMPPLPMGPTGRQDFKKQKRPPRGRAPIAANGPVHDRTKSTIVVQNIPQEHFTEADVRGYFSQFGTIVELTMQEDSRLAIIKYDTWDSANAAWSSPKVIFDNRFVKVFWYKDESEAGQGAKGKPTNGSMKNGASNGDTPAQENQEPDFDMDEFLRKQKEAQKLHEEKTQKRQQMEKERQQLEERQKELLARQQEEKRKLQAKLAAKSGTGASSPAGDAKSDNAGGEKPSSTQAEALRAQLAALEAEASSLGIDPNDAQDETYAWSGRGGRGRGGRVYRGRGTFPPRAARGAYGYRGRGGTEARHAAYASYSLDLRPKVIAITGADFTVPEKEEALRQYLFGTGEFKDIHIQAAATHITFKDRKTAEQFMFGVTAAGKNQIPGVGEKLELAWTATAPAVPPSAAAAAGEDGDTLMASGLEDAAAAATKEKASVEEGEAGDTAGNTAAAHLEDGEVGEDGGDQDVGDMDYEGIY